MLISTKVHADQIPTLIDKLQAALPPAATTEIGGKVISISRFSVSESAAGAIVFLLDEGDEKRVKTVLKGF